MSATPRPRRSILYMPGSNARALEKGRTLPVDGLILDLEDAVAPDAKEVARKQVVDVLSAGGYGKRERIARVNGLDTPWGEADIRAIARAAADALLIPKVESAEGVRRVADIMTSAGSDRMPIWCMIETPAGVLNAAAIARADQRVGCFVMGTSDLAKDLRAAHTRERLPMLTSLGLCLLAARAAGIAVLDGVHLDLADDAGFAEACRQGAALGFDGKTLIHPKTIAAANHAFAPSEPEVAWSRRIIAAHAEAAASGQGVVLVEGKLIENLHVENAHRLVRLAELIAELEQANTAL